MAARFRFRLEGLLKLRDSLEEEAQRKLANQLALQEQAQAALAGLQQAQAATIEGRRLAPNQPVDLDRWRDTERYLVVLERRILGAAETLALAQGRVAEARLELIKAHRDHLMLLRLKERRQQQHTLEALREEAREMDEMAVLRYRIAHAANTLLPGI